MQIITPILAASPILLCGFAILALRRSAVVGAIAGILTAAGLSIKVSKFSIDLDGLCLMLGTTGILTLSAFVVIVPGLYLNAILRAQGVIGGLVTWIQSIRLDSEQKALLLLLGILPAVESLTGFGVSLFLGIPIFFRLFSPERACRLSLVSMNIMPWGTLALATVVGASLSGYSTVELGTATALTSFLIYPTVGVIALFILGGRFMLRQYALAAVFLGLGLSASLYCFNKIGFVETAGIFSGLAVSALGFIMFRVFGQRSKTIREAVSDDTMPILHIFFPYVLLLSLLLLVRIIPGLHQWLADVWVLTSGRVKFSVLTSPGVALTAAGFFSFVFTPVKIDHIAVWNRSRTALSSLCCFIFFAQLMSESHMIATLADMLQQLKDHNGILMSLSALLGMVSGFITGSNLGGNALAIGMQQQIGSAINEGLLFSALQNSSAGAAVFMSLPIIILVMTIARDVVGEKKVLSKSAEYDLLRFGLCSGFFIYLALLISFAIARHVSIIELKASSFF
jgi:lactate permease